MKISVSVRRIAAFILLFAVMSALALPVFAEIEYPTPTDYIADDAAVLSEQTVKHTACSRGCIGSCSGCTAKHAHQIRQIQSVTQIEFRGAAGAGRSG